MPHFAKSRALLSPEEAQHHLAALNRAAVQYRGEENFWRIDNGKLRAYFALTTVAEKTAWHHAVAQLIKSANHHPQTTYDAAGCDLSYITHSAGGLTALDFYCALELTSRDDGESLPTH